MHKKGWGPTEKALWKSGIGTELWRLNRTASSAGLLWDFGGSSHVPYVSRHDATEGWALISHLGFNKCSGSMPLSSEEISNKIGGLLRGILSNWKSIWGRSQTDLGKKGLLSLKPRYPSLLIRERTQDIQQLLHLTDIVGFTHVQRAISVFRLSF
jgi:hypothetical protein